MLAVIEHLEYDQATEIIKNCYSLLKKSGILIITTPAHWSDPLLKIMAKLNIVSSEEINEQKHAYSMKELSKLLIYSNFKQENIQKLIMK